MDVGPFTEEDSIELLVRASADRGPASVFTLFPSRGCRA
jgi:hypothetical protein